MTLVPKKYINRHSLSLLPSPFTSSPVTQSQRHHDPIIAPNLGLDCLHGSPLKRTPKRNILLPLNRFGNPYQNSLQQCTPYHTPYIPPSNIIFIFSLTLRNQHAGREGYGRRERWPLAFVSVGQNTGRPYAPRNSVSLSSPIFAGPFPVCRWSTSRVLPPPKTGYRAVCSSRWRESHGDVGAEPPHVLAPRPAAASLANPSPV